MRILSFSLGFSAKYAPLFCDTKTYVVVGSQKAVVLKLNASYHRHLCVCNNQGEMLQRDQNFIH